MKNIFHKYGRTLPFICVIGMVVVYICLFSYLSIMRFLNFNAYYYDLGIMDQVVFNTSKGRILRMTDPEIARNTSRFSVHFDPLLITMAPFYMIKPSPLILLIAQTIVLGLGGLAIYLISKRVLKRKWEAVLFVFLYLNYYPLQLANLFDFHAVTFATTSILFMYYFLALRPLKRPFFNYLLGSLFLIITVFAKENASLIIVFFFGYLFLKEKKKPYLFLSLFFTGVFFFLVFQVIPYYRSASTFALSYFDTRNPLSLVSRLFSRDTYVYFQRLLSPMSLLSLLAPAFMFIAAPELLINILSSNSNLREMHFHYTAMITPFVMISAIYGYRRARSYVLNARLLSVLIALIIGVSVYLNVNGGTFNYPVGKPNERTLAEVYYWREKFKNQNIRISTTGTIAPFFTERRRYYYFLFDPAYQNMGKQASDILKLKYNYKRADYVIIRKFDVTSSDPIITDYYGSLLDDSDFSLISDKNGIEVYKNLDASPFRTGRR